MSSCCSSISFCSTFLRVCLPDLILRVYCHLSFFLTGPAAAPQQNNLMQPPSIPTNVDVGNKSDTLGNKKGKSKDKDKNKKLTKADIGAPTQFR